MGREQAALGRVSDVWRTARALHRRGAWVVPHAIRSDAPSICGRTSFGTCFSTPIFYAFAPFSPVAICTCSFGIQYRLPARAIGLTKQKIGKWDGQRRPIPLIWGQHVSLNMPCGFAARKRVALCSDNFSLIGSPKLVFRLVWRGSIAGIDCVRGVALNGKFQTFKRLTDVVFVEAA